CPIQPQPHAVTGRSHRERLPVKLVDVEPVRLPTVHDAQQLRLSVPGEIVAKVTDRSDTGLTRQLEAGAEQYETGAAFEDDRRLQSAAHAQIAAYAAGRAADVQLFAAT